MFTDDRDEARRLYEHVHGRPRRRRAGRELGAGSPGFLRPLLLVTGGLASLLIAAEVGNRLIGNAGVLAILVLRAGACIYLGFVLPESEVPGPRARWRAVLLPLLAVIGIAAYFGIRETRSLGELAELVEPLPGVIDVTYIPSGPEIQALSTFLAPAASGEAQDLSGITQRYWKVETALGVDEVRAFYASETNRRDWSVTDSSGGFLQMRRGDERLIVAPRCLGLERGRLSLSSLA